jgi:hypothetical protein
MAISKININFFKWIKIRSKQLVFIRTIVPLSALSFLIARGLNPEQLKKDIASIGAKKQLFCHHSLVFSDHHPNGFRYIPLKSVSLQKILSNE